MSRRNTAIATPDSYCAIPIPASDAVLALRPHAVQLSFGPNERLFSEGADARNAYIVETGVIRLCTTSPQRGRVIWDFRFRGDAIGLQRSAYPWTGEAVTAGELLCISMPDAKHLFEESASAVGLVAYAWQLESEAWRFHGALPGQSANQRLAAFLIRFSQRTNTPIGQPMMLPIGLNDIACHLDLPPEDLSAAFSELSRQGVIEIRSRGTCTILDATTMLGLAVQALAKKL